MTVIYDPAAAEPADVHDYTLTADMSRSGIRVGLVSNGFPDAETILTAIGDLLQDRLDSPEIRLIARDDPTVSADASDLAKARECDVVVTALGQCGSCTSSATRDAAAIAKLGVPAAALVSYKFLDLAQFVADSVRMPDVPRVALPHPVSGTGVANIGRIAEQVVDDVISALAGQSARVGAGA